MRTAKYARMLMQVTIAIALATSFAAAQSQTTAKPPVATYDPALLHPELLHRQAPAEYDVKMTTTKGIIVIHVTRAWAPRGADRFYNLVEHHYLDGASFFRAISGFMVQFGLSAYPPVNHAWQNANIPDDPVMQHNLRGYITFATAGPNTRTTQLFINLADNVSLDGQGFAPFGQVTQGMDVVDQLYTGYGEGAPGGQGPSQDDVAMQGHTYLERNFPKLDIIKSAVIVAPMHPAAAAAH